MPCVLLLTLALAPADAPTPPPDAAVSDAGELQGEWEVVGCNGGGLYWTDSFKGNRWVFAGVSCRLVGPADYREKPRTLRVDAAHCPAMIDSVDKDGVRSPGIYRRTGDELLWADGGPASGLPSSFDPAPGVVVWTLRRLKK